MPVAAVASRATPSPLAGPPPRQPGPSRGGLYKRTHPTTPDLTAPSTVRAGHQHHAAGQPSLRSSSSVVAPAAAQVGPSPRRQAGAAALATATASPTRRARASGGVAVAAASGSAARRSARASRQHRPPATGTRGSAAIRYDPRPRSSAAGRDARRRPPLEKAPTHHRRPAPPPSHTDATATGRPGPGRSRCLCARPSTGRRTDRSSSLRARWQSHRQPIGHTLARCRSARSTAMRSVGHLPLPGRHQIPTIVRSRG
ncbi:uncharacterized protein A4U43_C08F22580 [Asparagus officinalis]|nr:uncharacterized protein A4U43_C08F22580 [Asparagus officinalis]